MDAVEILLFGVVGLSVLVFLILNILDPSRVASSKFRIEESTKGVNGDAEKKSGSRECFQEREETDDLSKDEVIDDWEGVERSELEKIFGEAIVFANSKVNSNRIGEDLKLQLYGLQKVALEGNCYPASQPMAFNVSARSKWSAWQKLGNMSRETAMENYISILSEAFPKWKVEDTENYEHGHEEQHMI